MGIALSAAHQYNFVDRIVSQLYHRAHPPTPAATTTLNYCSPIEYANTRLVDFFAEVPEEKLLVNLL